MRQRSKIKNPSFVSQRTDYGRAKQKSKIANKNKDLVLLRLKRIEGQIKAIKRMYEEGKGCDKIIQQVLAVREALGGVAKILLKEEAVRCVRKPADLERSLENLLKIN